MAQGDSVENWGWPEEREFIENLVNARFGSLLVLFELVIVAAVMCQEQFQLQIVLWTGAIIIAPVALSIFGAQWKLGWILRKFRTDYPDSPIAGLSAAGKHLQLFWIIGYLVPLQCTVAVIAGAILASRGILHVRP